MKRLIAPALALLLAGCTAAPDPDVAGSAWQITDIWHTPGDPSTLPPQAAGLARLTFGEQSLTGHTGCVPLQGTVSFTLDGEPARAADADTLHIDHLEIDAAAPDCPAAHTHQQLTELIAPGAVFDVHHTDRALTLTLRGTAVDRPAIGLAAI